MMGIGVWGPMHQSAKFLKIRNFSSTADAADIDLRIQKPVRGHRLKRNKSSDLLFKDKAKSSLDVQIRSRMEHIRSTKGKEPI